MHAFLIVTFDFPYVTPIPATLRTVPRPHHNEYTFEPYKCIEQEEPGFTFNHTFWLDFPVEDTDIWVVLTDNCDPFDRHTYSPINVWQFTRNDPDQETPVIQSERTIFASNINTLLDSEIAVFYTAALGAPPIITSTDLTLQTLDTWVTKGGSTTPPQQRHHILFLAARSGPNPTLNIGSIAGNKAYNASVSDPKWQVISQVQTAEDFIITPPAPDTIITLTTEARILQLKDPWSAGYARSENGGNGSTFLSQQWRFSFGGTGAAINIPNAFVPFVQGPSSREGTGMRRTYRLNRKIPTPPEEHYESQQSVAVALFLIGHPLLKDVTREKLPLRRPF